VTDFTIEVPAHGTTNGRVYPAAAGKAAATLIVAHGAGAGHDSAFIVGFARAIAAMDVDAVTFNFLYIERRRRVPDAAPVLEATYAAVVDEVRERIASAKTSLFIGGKSMGGRIATQYAAGTPGAPIRGIVLLGYPLHPPGKPDVRRDAHLPSVGRPMLFVQGSRDAFGTPAELTPVLARLGSTAQLHVVNGGDHSFKIGRANAVQQGQIYADIQRVVVEWIASSITSPSGRKP
jgi:uncharacterized protein